MLLDGSQDPCAFVGAPPAGAPTAAQCAFSGVSAAQYGSVAPNPAAQYNGLLGGNPNLNPEVADTYSVGFVLQPRVVPNLSLSVDYFDIKIKETIGPITADTILLNCIQSGNPTYCSAVHRGPGGTLWRSSAWATRKVGHVSLVGGQLDFSAKDPKDAYGSLVNTLVGWVTQDLRSTWEKR